MPTLPSQNADAHSIQKTGGCGFWSGGLAMSVEPDNSCSMAATATNGPHPGIAITREHNRKESPLAAFTHPFREFPEQLESCADLRGKLAVEGDFLTTEANPHTGE